MDQLRYRLPFCSIFYVRKFLEMLYLFVSLRSVVLKLAVTLTHKTEHFLIANCRLWDCRLGIGLVYFRNRQSQIGNWSWCLKFKESSQRPLRIPAFSALNGS